MENLNRKINTEELVLILKNSTNRGSFISDYSYFGDDNNDAIYQSFIITNINKKSQLQEDAIELSIATHFFLPEILDVIKNIIYSKRGYWIKLLALDWLFNFSEKIHDDNFLELNSYISEKASNELLKIQAFLNLMLKNSKIYSEKLLNCLSKANMPASYYRVVSCTCDKKRYVISNEFMKTFSVLIKSAHSLTPEQKRELEKQIDVL